jgi:transposase
MSPTTNAVDISTIGIDTGKNTLHLIGVREQRMIVLREKLARGRIGGRIANVPPCLIGIEAGIGTHYVARELISLGHDVKRVPPAYAKPFPTHKNVVRGCGGDGDSNYWKRCASRIYEVAICLFAASWTSYIGYGGFDL